MLTNFEVRNLFGLYSYNLDFYDDEESCISILTGPNGYGKTTVLNLIHAIYAMDKQVLCDCPYDFFSIHFDGLVLECKQQRCFIVGDEETDVVTEGEVTLTLTFYTQDKPDTREDFVLHKSSDGITGEFPGELELFISSRFLRYITDDRLIFLRSDTSVLQSSVNTEVVESLAQELADNLKKAGAVMTEGNRLSTELSENINLFTTMIGKFAFSDKSMKIDPVFGFRFKHAVTGEFIPLKSLSSGEKHILIQVYNLIFKTPSGAVALVDEPEISLHPAWTAQYVTNIQEIQKYKSSQNRPFQVILATHSPILIGQRWNMTIDLFEQKIRI